MPNLCSYNSCTGCFACASVCPKNAIKREIDNHGFLRPSIDSSLCIECKACEVSCPILKEPLCRENNSLEPTTVAGWHNDLKIRLASSSGGAFSAIAEFVLKKGGVVYGAGWGDELKVVHKRVVDINGLEDLRKSKYLQSEIGDSLVQAKKDLQEGKIVLFAGTPCQIAGLYSFLHNKQYDNLYTIDFICHGVPSYKVFKSYISSLENKFNDTVDSVNFRDKSLGVECNLILKIKLHNKLKERNLIGKDISYYRGFVDELFLRESCYECKFNKLPRVADFSLADYRGLGDKEHFSRESERVYGFTGVMINNNHAYELFEKTDICYETRPFCELSGHQGMLRNPSSINKNTASFYEDLDKYGFSYTADKYMQMSRRRKIDLFLRRTFGARGYYALGRFVKKYILKSRTIS